MEKPMGNIHNVIKHLIQRAQTAAPGTTTKVRFREEEVTITFHGGGLLSMPKVDQNTLLGLELSEALNEIMPNSDASSTPKRREH